MDNVISAGEQLDGVRNDMGIAPSLEVDDVPITASLGLDVTSPPPARGVVFGVQAAWSPSKDADMVMTVTGEQDGLPVYGASWTHSAQGSPWTVWLTLADAAVHLDSALPISMTAELSCQGWTKATLSFTVV